MAPGTPVQLPMSCTRPAVHQERVAPQKIEPQSVRVETSWSLPAPHAPEIILGGGFPALRQSAIITGMTECVLSWVKDFAPIIVSIAVIWVTLSFNSWQRRLAREQLRHQLYERRIAVYGAFRELLLALPEKDNDEIKGLFFGKLRIARSEVPFLFEDDPKLQAYLEQLCKRVTEEVINNIFFTDGIKQQPAIMHDPKVAQDFATRANQLALAKLKIPEDHLARLPEEFAPFLRLTDLSKR